MLARDVVCVVVEGCSVLRTMKDDWHSLFLCFLSFVVLCGGGFCQDNKKCHGVALVKLVGFA